MSILCILFQYQGIVLSNDLQRSQLVVDSNCFQALAYQIDILENGLSARDENVISSSFQYYLSQSTSMYEMYEMFLQERNIPSCIQNMLIRNYIIMFYKRRKSFDPTLHPRLDTLCRRLYLRVNQSE